MNNVVSLTSLQEQVCRIPLDKILESIVTLRTEYGEEGLYELSDSFADQGQLQPIVVQPAENGYFELVIGSRRLRAAKLRKQHDIAGFVIEKRAPVQLLFIAMAENIHRVDLNPFEEAQGYLRLMKEYDVSLKDVARGVNKTEKHVTTRLQILSMPEEVVSMVSDRILPINFVQTLARLPSGDEQTRFAHSAVQNRLTHSELTAEVRKELREPSRKERETHEVTPLKVQARISEFVTFLQKVPRRINMRRVNASEKFDLLRSLNNLKAEVESLHDTVKGSHTTSPTPLQSNLLGGNVGVPNNHGQEWPMEHLRKINSARRPSDEVLAKELGRTVGAIRGMRALTQEKSKVK